MSLSGVRHLREWLSEQTGISAWSLFLLIMIVIAGSVILANLLSRRGRPAVVTPLSPLDADRFAEAARLIEVPFGKPHGHGVEWTIQEWPQGLFQDMADAADAAGFSRYSAILVRVIALQKRVMAPDFPGDSEHPQWLEASAECEALEAEFDALGGALGYRRVVERYLNQHQAN